MIALASQFTFQNPSSPRTFVDMLPVILRHLHWAFRNMMAERKEDAIQEALANCFVAYARLVKQGRDALAFPAALARYAVKQFHSGRRVGMRLNVKDVMSEFCQQRKGITVEPIHLCAGCDDDWREAVGNDPHTPVFHQVWFRLDYPA